MSGGKREQNSKSENGFYLGRNSTCRDESHCFGTQLTWNRVFYRSPLRGDARCRVAEKNFKVSSPSTDHSSKCYSVNGVFKIDIRPFWRWLSVSAFAQRSLVSPKCLHCTSNWIVNSNGNVTSGLNNFVIIYWVILYTKIKRVLVINQINALFAMWNNF